MSEYTRPFMKIKLARHPLQQTTITKTHPLLLLLIMTTDKPPNPKDLGNHFGVPFRSRSYELHCLPLITIIGWMCGINLLEWRVMLNGVTR